MKKLTIGHYFLAFIIAIGFILLIGLSACKVKTKDVAKEKQDIKIEQVLTTTTTIDTTVTVGGDTATVVAPVFELFKGDTIVAESNGTVVKLSYNKKNNTVTARAITKTKAVPIQATKTQTSSTKADIKTTSVHRQQTVKSDFAGNVKLGILLTIISVIAGLFIYWRLKANQII
jgi:hypothetical protein